MLEERKVSKKGCKGKTELLMESPSLEVSKNRVDVALGDVVSGHGASLFMEMQMWDPKAKERVREEEPTAQAGSVLCVD